MLCEDEAISSQCEFVKQTYQIVANWPKPWEVLIGAGNLFSDDRKLPPKEFQQRPFDEGNFHPQI